MKAFCREFNCGMSFSTNRHRDEHEKLMHKDMTKQAAYAIVDKIHASNTSEDLKKKVIKTPKGNFSYEDAYAIIKGTGEDAKAILAAMEQVVETFFSHYPEYGVKEILQTLELKIK